jgi:hypothetical protein
MEPARIGKSPRICVSRAYSLSCGNQTKRDRIARMNTSETATPLFVNSPMCSLPASTQKPLPVSNLAPSLPPTLPGQDWRDDGSTGDDEVNSMRRLGRRTSWLGWVVAGVLLVAAGGAALAAQDTTTTTQGPGGLDKADKARAGALGRVGGLRHGLGRRVLHGEVTVQTREGVKTIVMARGEVTALSGDAITVKSSDGVETSFGIDGDTRYGFRNETGPSAELKVGEDAFVAGEKSGDRAVAKRVVSGELARRAATP